MTREEWLNAALSHCRTRLAAVGCIVPQDARVSIGFPGGGSARKRIGECWTRAQSSIGVNEMFISPTVSKPLDMVAILLHEAIHAADDCANGHKGPFRKWALAAGLEGEMTATVPGQACRAWIDETLKLLPEYSQGSLSLSGRTKQTTRMGKFECTGCGCTVRASSKWADTICASVCECGSNFAAA